MTKTPVWHLLRGQRDYQPVYHEHARNDLIQLLQRTPSRVLDIGCAAGATARLLREHYPDLEIIGVELDRQAAELASSSVDELHVRSITELLADPPVSWLGCIDTVILGDVLEHLVDPWSCLEKLRPLLTSNAQVLVSLPNLRNLRVIEQLAVDGLFSYQDAGILDVTHLRFFTRSEMLSWFSSQGFGVTAQGRTMDSAAASMLQRISNTEAGTDRLLLRGLDDQDFEELTTIQYLWNLSPDANAPQALSVAPAENRQQEEKSRRQAYHQWVLSQSLLPARRQWMEEALQGWVVRPSIHLTVFALPEQYSALRETCFSLSAQLYQDWRLTILAFEPPAADFPVYDRVHWQVLGDDDDSLDVLNAVLHVVPADWVGVLYPGDRLAPQALFGFMQSTQIRPDWQLVYCDEDLLIEQSSERDTPLLKPDFNLDLLRAFNYFGGLTLYRQALFSHLGGFNGEFEGVEDHDLNLRVAEQLGREQIGHLAEVYYHRAEHGRMSGLDGEERQALNRLVIAHHLARSGLVGEVLDGPRDQVYRIRYHSAVQPLVSILIPTKDHAKDLARCLHGILQATDYPHIEVILIDNQTTDAEALAVMDQAAQDSRVQILRYDAPFNFSAMNNAAADLARGEYLLLLNNDTAVLHPDWLARMVAILQRADVAAVGARLQYQNGCLQHAGVVLGIGHGVAEHVFIGQSKDAEAYLSRNLLTQAYSAVTGACLLCRKQDYLTVGGLDAANLAVSYQDVDLCLKLAQDGRWVVWTPEASLIHDGSQTLSQKTQVDASAEEAKRIRFEKEQDTMFQRWSRWIGADPAYNRNLTLANRDAGLEMDPLLCGSGLFRPKPLLLACPSDVHGCGEYRIRAPMRSLIQAGVVDGNITERLYGPTEIMRISPDVVVMQRQLADSQIAAIERYRKRAGAFVIFELDDLITQPLLSVDAYQIHQKNSEDRLQRALAECDRFVASTALIAETYGSWCRETVVVPNYIPGDKWGRLIPVRRQGKKARVGWAGGSTHGPDLDMIANVIKQLHHEVEWVFLGMCPESLRPFVHEYHQGVPIEGYPAKLASLDLDLALAPLIDHPFNHARSNLRLLEYGVLGYPVVCSDAPSFRGDYPVVRVGNRTDEWVDAIRCLIADRDRLAEKGDAMRAHIREHWLLEKHLDVWAKAWLPG